MGDTLEDFPCQNCHKTLKVKPFPILGQILKKFLSPRQHVHSNNISTFTTTTTTSTRPDLDRSLTTTTATITTTSSKTTLSDFYHNIMWRLAEKLQLCCLWWDVGRPGYRRSTSTTTKTWTGATFYPQSSISSLNIHTIVLNSSLQLMSCSFLDMVPEFPLWSSLTSQRLNST